MLYFFSADLKTSNPELIDLCARKGIINMGDDWFLILVSSAVFMATDVMLTNERNGPLTPTNSNAQSGNLKTF